MGRVPSDRESRVPARAGMGLTGTGRADWHRSTIEQAVPLWLSFHPSDPEARWSRTTPTQRKPSSPKVQSGMAVANDWIEVLSGERRGPRAAALRTVLWGLTPLYRLGLVGRSLLWRWGWKRAAPAPVPVISVGNLTTGGTGKTPLVIWLARQLRAEGWRVAILSRGYRGPADGGSNDETLEVTQRLPDVPVIENPDRVAAAAIASDELEMQVCLMDDGFQHWRLARNLDLVVIDATRPFGFDHLLPRGLLREPLSALRRANQIVISKANLVDAAALQSVLQRIRRYHPAAAIAVAGVAPVRITRSDRVGFPLDHLDGQPLLAACAIGNPTAFFRSLEQLGFLVAARRSWPDHHHFGDADLAELERLARDCGASAILCTAKDLVKIPRNRLGQFPLYALETDLVFSSGEEQLRQAVLQAIGPLPPSPEFDGPQ